MKNKLFILVGLIILTFPLLVQAYAPHKRLLFFLPYEEYSANQFNKLYAAFIEQGYTVDVVSAVVGTAKSEDNAESFSVPVSSAPNSSKIVAGQTTIQSIAKNYFAQHYDGFICIGGRGSEAYFYDGFFTSTDKLSHLIVAEAASAINRIINEALLQNKIIGGLEYGAGLIGFSKLENSSGNSVLKNKNATTWDYNQNLVNYFRNLNINLLDGSLGPGQGDALGDAELVVIDGPENYSDLIVTGRDSSDLTIDYFTRVFLNALVTYPDFDRKNYLYKVLVFGGDESLRHNIPASQVAKHTDIANNLNTKSSFPVLAQATGDENWFNSALQILDKNNPNYFDAVVYFRQNATGNQSALNQTIKNYVERGGLLIILHHGLFNDNNSKGNLNALTGLVGLAGGEIPANLSIAEMVYPGPHYFLNVNLGHFISTYNIISATRRSYFDSNIPSTIGNLNSSTNTYFSFAINPDELITLINVNPAAQVTPLFANNYASMNRLIGWTRNVGQGKVVFYEPGERNDSSLLGENFRVLENAILWGNQPAVNRYTPVSTATYSPTPTPSGSVISTFTPIGTPKYEAKWISQTQGKGEGINRPFILKPGESVEVEAIFLNKGNRPWYRDTNRQDFVGFYVYKDPIYSTPLEFNDPQNPFYGTSYFADDNWGSSFDKKTLNCRAALLVEDVVFPGEIGHFRFTFKAAHNTIANSAFDNPNTRENEYYYREDLTLAYGPEWMDNRTNGDPLGKAHVWFPLRVVNP